MNKKITINLNRLKDAQFMEFCLEFQKILIQYGSVFEIEKFEKIFSDDFDILKESFKKLKTNAYTEQIKKLDQKRDNSIQRLGQWIKTYLLDPDPKLYNAAYKLQDIFKNYGGFNIIRKDLNAQTASIENMLDQFYKKTKNEIELLKLENVLKCIEVDNLAFRKSYEIRMEIQTQNNLLSKIKDLRTSMTLIFTTIQKNSKTFDRIFPEHKKEINSLFANLDAIISKYHPLTISVKKTKKEPIETENNFEIIKKEADTV